jgi:hypothetical protein
MQHQPQTPLHRSTLWRRKQRPPATVGRRRVDESLDRERLALAAGIIDQLNATGRCPLHLLTSPGGAFKEAQLLRGSDSTVESLQATKIQPLRVLYWTAFVLMDVNGIGEVLVKNGDGLLAARLPGESFADVESRLDEKRLSKTQAGRTRKGAAISSVNEFRSLGLTPRMCSYIKRGPNRMEGLEVLALIKCIAKGLTNLSTRERLNDALVRLPKLSRQLNKGLAAPKD